MGLNDRENVVLIGCEDVGLGPKTVLSMVQMSPSLSPWKSEITWPVLPYDFNGSVVWLLKARPPFSSGGARGQWHSLASSAQWTPGI